jgi:hypothetical protein
MIVRTECYNLADTIDTQLAAWTRSRIYLQGM